MSRINWPVAIVIALFLIAAFTFGLGMSPHLVAECHH